MMSDCKYGEFFHVIKGQIYFVKDCRGGASNYLQTTKNLFTVTRATPPTYYQKIIAIQIVTEICVKMIAS